MMKYRKPLTPLIDRLFEEVKISSYAETIKQEPNISNKVDKKDAKRMKERSIKEVIKKVALWRKVSDLLGGIGKNQGDVAIQNISHNEKGIKLLKYENTIAIKG